jgi:NitT/TauT family transport system substrate-binding protein
MPPPSLSRRSVMLLAAAAGAAPWARAQGKPEKARIQIAVEGRAAFCNLPLTISEQLGYFRNEGLEVEIADFGPGVKALQALSSGNADVVSGPYEHTIQLQARNQFLQTIVLTGRAPQVAMGVSTKGMPHYRNPGDLRGKRIGVSWPGSSANMVANLVLSRAGLKAQDVSYVAVGTAPGALSALRTGQIDAMSNMEPVMTMLEQKGEVRIIGDTRTLKGTQDVFGGPMPAGCLYASLEFVRSNPNTCQALANGIVHGLKWLQTAGPSDIIKTVPESYLLGDRALYLASFNKVREAIALDGLLPDDGAKTALRAVINFEPGLKADKVDLAKTYTNDFARKAKEKFKA